MSEKKKNLFFIVLIGVFVFAVVYGGITLTRNFGKSQVVITTERAMQNLDNLMQDIRVNTIEPRKIPVSLEPSRIEDTLPDISNYPIRVYNSTQDYIEIFSSPEKAGENTDSWLIEVAEAFNNAGIEINGKGISVKIREIASGTGTDYIISGKYLPDAFTPSNDLWGKMIESSGQNITLVEERLVGNVAGVLFSRKKHDELINKYGAINQRVITEAVETDQLAMGYTNPFASSTGLNFLLSTLNTFDERDILSDRAVDGFERFQANIPFVAYTTMQMRGAASSGALDGFVMEYQTYTNSRNLRSDYVFTAFGLRHDNPLYQIGDLSPMKKEILDKFTEFCKKDKYQELASRYGFNMLDEYVPEMNSVDGDTILQAQRLWKEKKDSNQEIISVFVADISGSMDGEPLNRLKESLLVASEFIGDDNSIGLVTFSSNVNINLPIAKFDINQRSYFTGAVTDMQAGGMTAMFDGIVVATRMLMEEKEKNPDAKLMLFVLGDGETNRGHSFNDVEGILEALNIPIYTIGYNADIKILQNLSEINEAATINAESDDVVYQLRNLFNAQM
ncbi:vWA domain-containing protein [Natronospora cellulosivora (SeqCode)]